MTLQSGAPPLRTFRWMPALFLASSLLQAACAGMDGASARLAGNVTYGEQVELPPDAQLEVIIEDVSRADTRAEVIARAAHNPRSLPATYAIDYRADLIQPGHRYNVRARIEQQGRLLFITDSHHALPPAGSTAPLDLKVVRTGVSAASTAMLQNTYWKLLQLGDARVTTPEGQREARLVLQATRDSPPRLTGFGGCNNFTGSYVLDGERIAFSQVASTMMACTQGMETEKAFHAMLARASRWAIRGEQLDLFDAAGTRIALFESVYLR